MAEQQVFISYAWGGESETVADEIEGLLQANSIRLVRDKTDLGFKGLIRDFMEQIGQGNLVVLVITDKYLKSKNCMFELMEVAKKGEFHSRVFPVVLSDANIYDSMGLLTYLKYWDQKIKELNASAKELDNLADTRKVQEDINLYTDIRGTIDGLAGEISDMNTLTLEIMRSKKYQPLLDALGEKLGQPSSPAKSSKKEGKVLYHIPAMMQINAWTRCTVRLAWEEILLTEGLNIPKEQLNIESIRLASIMQVSLVEGKAGGNFEISAINNEEQFIDEDDFTEWLYDVKPINLGSFTLVLRITLIQIIEGREKKKDLVLEREVTTEAYVPKALQKFETAETGLPRPELHLEESILPELAEDAEGFERIEIEQAKSWEPEESLAGEENYESESTEDDGTGNSTHSGSNTMPRNVGASTPPPDRPMAFPMPPPPPSTRHSKMAGAPSRPMEQPRMTAPPPKRSRNKWLVPFTASAAGFILIAMFIFPRMGSESSAPDPSVWPDEYSEGSPMPNTSEPKEKMVLILSRNAHTSHQQSTSPDQIYLSRNLFFIVDQDQMDSLNQVDFGAYAAQVIPIADTLDYNLGVIREYSVQEIQDSLFTVSKKAKPFNPASKTKANSN